MNPMSIMAQAEKLGIPELQRSIQDGVVPAFIGVPLLQEKVKRQKQMQMGMAAQQPKKPSVAEQVGQEAQQATIADIMKAQALRMQGEMGQTGGISDSLPKPEGYAKGGPIAFAARGLVPGETMAEQLQRLLDEQRAADYGWSEETANAYEPKYYQTPEEARASMSRRNLAPTKQVGELYDEYLQAQSRAKAQTGLGVRSGNTIELPPTGLSPYQYTGDVMNAPNYSPVIEGQSYVHPTSTPRADMEARLAEREAFVGPRKGAAFSSPEAQAYLRDPSFIGRGTPIDEFVGPLNRAGKIAQFEGAGARLGSPLGADAQLVQKLSMPGVTGYDYKDPAMRSRLQSLFGMEHIKEPSQPAPNIKDLVAQARAKPFGESNLPMLEGYGNSLMPVAIDRRASVPAPATKNILSKNAPNKQAPDVDQAQAMQNRIAARKASPVMGGNAPAPTQTPYAQAAAPVAPATQAPATQEEEKDLTLAERMKEYRDAAGENKGIAALQSRLAEREARMAKEEERAPWMALMQAGLATMAGTSPNALTNIGQGGVAGLQAYNHSMNKLEDAKDKSFEIQAKLEEAQRNEELAAAKYGLDSVQADKKARLTAKLEREKMANNLEVHKLSYAAHIQAAEIQAGATRYSADTRNAAYGGAGKPVKLTDQQRYYSNMEDAMAADPNYRRDLRLPNGKPDPAKLAIEYRKTFKDVQNEALFGGMGMGGGMGSGMMSAQPDPRYRMLSQQ